MQKLLVLVAVLSVMVSCNRDKDDHKADLVQIIVTSKVSFNNEPDWVLKVQNPVWNHVYDSTELLITNTSTNIQTKFFTKTNSFAVTTSAGTYNMYMSTKDPRAVESFIHFSANTPSAVISSGGPTITLTADSKQALLLVTKAAVDAAPTLTIGTKTYTMYLQTGGVYYYAYVYAPSQTAVKLNMVIATKASSRDLLLQQQKRYVVTNPVNGNVTSTDPITTVVQI